MQAAIEQGICSRLADHLVSLPGSEWALWRTVCLRGAGFPAAHVLKLSASSELVKAADNLLDREQLVSLAQDKALQVVNHALDQMRQNNQWDNKPRRKILLKTREKLRAGQIPSLLSDLEAVAAGESLRVALEDVESSRRIFQENFSASLPQLSHSIREIVACPRFREAVTWQNRGVVDRALNSLLRKNSDGGSRTQRQRQSEELVASYLQRYCAKNDTIGFFGPVGWAKFGSEREVLLVKPGKNFVATRRVYFETWPIQALAAVIARDPDIYPWLRPLLMPFIRIDGLTLHHPIYGSKRMTTGQVGILRACDGRLPAKRIVEKLLHLPGAYFKRPAEIYQSLADLAAKRLIFWGFNIPFEAYQERALRAALCNVDNRAA